MAKVNVRGRLSLTDRSVIYTLIRVPGKKNVALCPPSAKRDPERPATQSDAEALARYGKSPVARPDLPAAPRGSARKVNCNEMADEFAPQSRGDWAHPSVDMSPAVAMIRLAVRASRPRHRRRWRHPCPSTRRRPASQAGPRSSASGPVSGGNDWVKRAPPSVSHVRLPRRSPVSRRLATIGWLMSAGRKNRGRAGCATMRPCVGVGNWADDGQPWPGRAQPCRRAGRG